jgi:hypothetical protein
LIKSRIHHLKEKFVATENSFPLSTSVFDTSSWPSATHGLLESGNSKIEAIAIHLKKMLFGDGNDDKMLNDIMGE